MTKQSVEIGNKERGHWGSVRAARTGWIVEMHSRWQGSRTGRVVHVPYSARAIEVRRDADLSAFYNDYMSNADHVLRVAVDHVSQCTVRKAGIVVQ